MTTKYKNRILLIVFCVFLTLFAVKYFSNQYSTLKSTESNFIVDTSLICRIEIENKKSKVVLQKTEHGNWITDDNQLVNQQYLNFSLRIFSQIKISSLVPERDQNEIADTLKNKGTHIQLFNCKGKSILAYYVYSHIATRKVYMMKTGSDKPYVVELPGYEGNFAAIFTLNKIDWLNPYLFTNYLPQLKEFYVENYLEPQHSFSITYDLEKKQLLLFDSKEKEIAYDKDVMKAYQIFISEVKVEKFLSDTNLIHTLEAKKLYQITLSTIQDDKIIFQFYPIILNGKEDKNFCYVLINKKQLAVIQYYNLAPVIRDVNFFTKKL